MWISWLHNLFCNLTIIYVYNNNFSTKTTKFRKLVIGATELETRMQRHCVETCDNGYVLIPLCSFQWSKTVVAVVKAHCQKWAYGQRSAKSYVTVVKADSAKNQEKERLLNEEDGGCSDR